MTINGKEVDFRISNLEHAEKMEIALQHMQKSENDIRNLKEGTPLSEALRKMITVFRDFFVEATGVDILEDCLDLEEAKQAYSDFLLEVKKQKEIVLAPFSLEQIQ